MTLRRIQVSDFRCLRSAEVIFDPELTLLTGPNASGKTSLLEAIYVLGRGRSFRTRRLDKLIRTSAERFVVTGLVARGEHELRLGIEGTPDGMRGKMGGDRVATLAEFAAVLPVQIIDPEVHRLIEEGPAQRRRFLDWGVFHVEHGFVERWQHYQQVLKQRNAALRSAQARPLVAVWDTDLLRLGTAIDEERRRYVKALTEHARGLTRELLAMELDLGYRAGWARELSFEEALRRSWQHDLDAGATQVGPQRAELAIKLDGLPVRDRISRGQQKLLAAVLLIAQLRLLPSNPDQPPTLLLDDPAAELDSGRLRALIREVHGRAVQLVVTSLGDFDGFGRPGRRYSIEGGVITPR